MQIPDYLDPKIQKYIQGAGWELRGRFDYQDLNSDSYFAYLLATKHYDPERGVAFELYYVRTLKWYITNTRRSKQHTETTGGLEDIALDTDASCVDEYDTLSTLIDRLPTKQAQVMRLRYYEDLRLTDIAEVIGCTRVTVSSHIREALKTLRGWLNDA